MKTVSQEKENIRAVLQQGLEKGKISKAEMEEALGFSTWESLQPFLNKAQGIHAPSPDNLVLAREEAPLHRSSVTPSELEKLKSLAPEEYELLR